MAEKTNRSSGRRALVPALALPVALLFASLAAAGGASMSASSAALRASIPPLLIRGEAQEGQILRVELGKSRRRAALSIQWRLCDPKGNACVDIAKATDRIYAVRHGDVGRTLRVFVIAIRDAAPAPALSAATAVVSPLPPDAPVNSILPTIAGQPLVGTVLTAQAGTWTGKQPITLQYNWRRCDEQGGSCQALRPEGQTYTVRDADVAHALRVLVIAKNSVETSAALSEPTPTVPRPTPAPPHDTAPRNTSPPFISGTPQRGKTLTVSSGSWSGTTPMLFSHAWLRCDRQGAGCARISSASAQTYTPSSADVGNTLRVRVTATNSAGARSAESAPTQVVVAADAPVNTALPSISGTVRRSETLTASSGSWKGTEPIGFSFRWLRCDARGAGCAPISGATSQKYLLADSDIGRTLRVEVTATNSAGAATALSNPSAVVAATGTAPASTSPPGISGLPQQGQTLTLSDGGWSGTPPVRLSYAWQRCDANGNNCATIAGATSNRYTLTASDVTRRVRGHVTASNDFGSSAAFSNLTEVVKGPPVLVSPPVVAGQAVPGQTLTASTGNWTSVSALSFTYQWVRCDAQGQRCAPITGAGPNLRSYTLTAADVGHRLFVQVKAINQSGATFANSQRTDVIAPAPVFTPPSTTVSISSVSLPNRLMIDRIQFVPARIHSRAEPLTLRVHVSETLNRRAVSGALVYSVGVPFNRLSAEREAVTGTDGWATVSFRVLPTFALKRGNFVVAFVRARKPGENVLAGVSTRRLVSVRVG
jgi:hypothetical protein